MIKFKTVLIIIFLLMICVQANMFTKAEEMNYRQLFPRSQVIDVKVEIGEELLKNIYQNPMDEEYYPASVDYNGHKLDVVGIRTRKNNLSLASVSNMEFKEISFKIKFDKYITGQNLFGLTTINLNNNINDPSYLREFLSYQLMEDMEVPTPEFSFVNLYINGELNGFYLAVQEIDQFFVKNNFEKTDGDLYKPSGENSDLLWRGNNINSYNGLGHKSYKNTDHQPLLNMLNELNNGVEYEKYLNIDEILRYFAVNTVLANMDSYQGIMKHNYYLYEEDGVFSIIPEDFKMSFGGTVMDGLNQEDLISLKIDEPTMGPLKERPLIANLLEVPEYKEKYHQYIKNLITAHLEVEIFKQETKKLADFIRPYVKEDPDKLYTIEEFDSSTLCIFVSRRVDNVSKQLSGEIPSTGDGSGMGIKISNNGNIINGNHDQLTSEAIEEKADIFKKENFNVKNNGKEEANPEMTVSPDVIIIKYFDIISSSFMLLIMMILSVLFLKRKI